MKVIFSASTKYVGSEVTETVDLEDGMEDEEIDEACRDWLYENISYGWEKSE